MIATFGPITQNIHSFMSNCWIIPSNLLTKGHVAAVSCDGNGAIGLAGWLASLATSAKKGDLRKYIALIGGRTGKSYTNDIGEQKE